MKTTALPEPEPKALVTLRLTEHGVGPIYIHADNDEQQRAAHALLAKVTPKLRELDALAAK
jgi:hypothetical protein